MSGSPTPERPLESRVEEAVERLSKRVAEVNTENAALKPWEVRHYWQDGFQVSLEDAVALLAALQSQAARPCGSLEELKAIVDQMWRDNGNVSYGQIDGDTAQVGYLLKSISAQIATAIVGLNPEASSVPTSESSR